MGRTQRLIAILLGLALLGAACSSDDDATEAVEDAAETAEDTADDAVDAAEDAADDAADAAEDAADDAADATEDAADDAADATEDAADDAAEAAEDAADATEDAATADGAVAVDLGEWYIDTPTTFDAGTITFTVGNSGENPHAFAIARGTSYEELPLLDNGGVDTDALGDDYLGTTENLDTGSTEDIAFDLEAGDYVFFCPIQFGPNSHAARGQVLSVTVG